MAIQDMNAPHWEQKAVYLSVSQRHLLHATGSLPRDEYIYPS